MPDAASAILIAIATNTAAKAVMATVVAGRRVGVAVGLTSAVAIAAIAVTHLLAPGLPVSLATETTERADVLLR
jgi:hypothetical protein